MTHARVSKLLALILGSFGVFILLLLHQCHSTPKRDAKSNLPLKIAASVDPKTGNGTPWTVIWDGHGGAYSWTWFNGNRSERTFETYSSAFMAMFEMQRVHERRWSVAPSPTPQPKVSPSPTPIPSMMSGIWTSGLSSLAIATPAPIPPAASLRIYNRDQAENWMTVMQCDPLNDRSWAPENVKVETLKEPQVTRNNLTDGWTIEFVK